MPKWCKTLIACALLPACFGAARALVLVVRANAEADTVWVALAAGAACWGVIYLLLPKPMWVYVLGHEFTHALWTWLFGGRVTAFKASSDGGHVVVTKSNFLIALAPYFFPVYAILVVGAFTTGDLIWNWHPYSVWFHLALGAAYAFHVSLTWHILKGDQSDITSQGYLFSAVIIFLGNIVVLLVGLPLIAGRVRVGVVFQWWWQATAGALQWLAKIVGH
jgi:hypothetical protein